MNKGIGLFKEAHPTAQVQVEWAPFVLRPDLPPLGQDWATFYKCVFPTLCICALRAPELPTIVVWSVFFDSARMTLFSVLIKGGQNMSSIPFIILAELRTDCHSLVGSMFQTLLMHIA